MNGGRKIMGRWLFDRDIEIFTLLRVNTPPSTSNYYGGSDSLLRSSKATTTTKTANFVTAVKPCLQALPHRPEVIG